MKRSERSPSSALRPGRHREKRQSKYPVGTGGHADNLNSAARIGIDFPRKAEGKSTEMKRQNKRKNASVHCCELAVFQVASVFRLKGTLLKQFSGLLSLNWTKYAAYKTPPSVFSPLFTASQKNSEPAAKTHI